MHILNHIKSFLKLVQTNTKNFFANFRDEELFFGLPTIGTILIDHGSAAPAVASLCLLGFYI